jgi:hypothetical protein
VPALIPLTIPLDAPTEAVEDEVLQLPPPVAQVRGIVRPSHTCNGPDIAAGSTLTVIVFDRVQPVPTIPHTIVTVPGVTPITIPLEAPTVATDGVPELHVQPGVVVDNVAGWPTHAVPGPVIAAGNGFTVTVALRPQPPAVYVIPEVPALLPLTTPEAGMTVAAVPETLQLPPRGVLLNVVVDPIHTFNAPVITDGTGLTVTVAVLEQPAPSEYVMTVVPGADPVTMPDVPIPATDGVALLHAPPLIALLSAVVEPGHTVRVPRIGPGDVLTVIVRVDVQPPDAV